MALDHSLVGVPTEPQERSWTSTDALLYAVGVGAGLGDPLQELEFTTENSEGVQQQVLPTFGSWWRSRGPPASSAASTGRCWCTPSRRFELHQPLPVEGTVSIVSTVTGIYDKISGALVASESVATDAATGAKLVTSRSGVFIRGEGGFGGDRGPEQRLAAADRRARPPGGPADQAGAGAAVPPVRRPEPAARGPGVRGQGRVQPADPARPVHLRGDRPGPAAHAVRLGPGQVPVDVRAVHAARSCPATRW